MEDKKTNARWMEIQSNCVCAWCETCEMGTWTNDEMKCDECGGKLEWSEWCHDCAEMVLACWADLLDEWLAANGSPTRVRIDGAGMGWTRSGGHTTVDATADAVLDALTFNADWRVRFELEGPNMTARRWSHDEPMGSATFTLAPVAVCEICGDDAELAVTLEDGVTRCESCMPGCDSCGETITMGDADAVTNTDRPWCGGCVNDGAIWACVGCGDANEHGELCGDCCGGPGAGCRSCPTDDDRPTFCPCGERVGADEACPSCPENCADCAVTLGGDVR